MRIIMFIFSFTLASLLAACTHSSSSSGCATNATAELDYEQLYQKTNEGAGEGFVHYVRGNSRDAHGQIVRLIDNVVLKEFTSQELLSSGDLFADLPSFDLSANKLIAHHLSTSKVDEDNLSSIDTKRSLLFGYLSRAQQDLSTANDSKIMVALSKEFEKSSNGHATVCSTQLREMVMGPDGTDNQEALRVEFYFEINAHQ